MTLLGRPEREVWRMPMGDLLDQIACYSDYHFGGSGSGNSTQGTYIDELMPPDI